jgi:CheY-like chemotaxis protein
MTRDVSLRLLLVEDHEPTLQVLARLLTRAGHQVVPANSVAGALAAAKAGTFDAIVSDLGLPDGTGFEVMSELRASYGLRGIALSGYGMEEDMRRSREAGFEMHLVKPVDFGQLRRAIAQLQKVES